MSAAPCDTDKEKMSSLGLIYMSNCVWQHRNKTRLASIPDGFEETTINGYPAYKKKVTAGRKTRARRGRKGRKSRRRITRRR